MPTISRAPRYQLGRGADPTSAAQTPTWVLAVVRLNQPLTYSRRTQRSIGTIAEGAFTRKAEPLVIVDDCVSLRITDSKRSHTKTLEATLKGSGTNYLDSDVMLPGDWLFAWIHDYPDDVPDLIRRIRRGDACNAWRDGLKFVGRVHSVNKTLDQAADGLRSLSFDIQGLGFAELDTQFFYDFALATAAASDRFSTFMAQLGLDFTNWTGQQLSAVERLKDNGANLILALLDIIVGRGVSDVVNRPLQRARDAAGGGIVKGQIDAGAPELRVAPSANKEAPAAYLVPAQVAGLLGASSPSKAGIHGYADLLQVVVGVQDYLPDAPGVEPPSDFQPVLKEGSTFNRKLCFEHLKGTFLPVNPSFVNRPLWGILQQYLNSSINEMYTTLRADESGQVRPTLVVRQIPFSSESIREDPTLQLTRFLSLPRWVVPDVLATSARIGRSDATRCNYLHVYGEAFYAASNEPISKQLVRNAPIVDEVDIQRSGIRAQMSTVNCALFDQRRTDGAGVWMEAIADWSFGSQYTLNGSIQLFGVQAPICCGDNLEFEGVAYHIESISQVCQIAAGHRTWRTGVELSNGMPVDQDESNADSPRYPGFHIRSVTKKKSRQLELDEGDLLITSDTAVTQTDSTGDAEVGARLDPGVSLDSIYKP